MSAPSILQELEALTREMNAFALQEQWDKLNDLEARRKNLLQQLPALPQRECDVAGLQHLNQLNADLIARIRSRRDEIGDLLAVLGDDPSVSPK